MLPASPTLRSLLQLCCLLLVPLLSLAPAAADLVATESTRIISISALASSSSGESGMAEAFEAANFAVPFDKSVSRSLVLDTIFGSSLASQQDSLFSSTIFSATGTAQTTASSIDPDSVATFSAASDYTTLFGVDTAATYTIAGTVSHAGSAFSNPDADLGRAFIELSEVGGAILFSREAAVGSFTPFDMSILLAPGVAYSLTAGASAFANLGEMQTSSSSTSAFSFALVIPEPHTANLLAAGMLGLALWSRWRSH